MPSHSTPSTSGIVSALDSMDAIPGGVGIEFDPPRLNLFVKAETELNLDQMLAAFDPSQHGGEVMAGGAVGAEAFSVDQQCFAQTLPLRLRP